MDLAQDALHKSTKGFLNRAARTVLLTFVVTKVNSFETVTVNKLQLLVHCSLIHVIPQPASLRGATSFIRSLLPLISLDTMVLRRLCLLTNANKR